MLSKKHDHWVKKRVLCIHQHGMVPNFNKLTWARWHTIQVHQNLSNIEHCMLTPSTHFLHKCFILCRLLDARISIRLTTWWQSHNLLFLPWVTGHLLAVIPQPHITPRALERSQTSKIIPESWHFVRQWALWALPIVVNRSTHLNHDDVRICCNTQSLRAHHKPQMIVDKTNSRNVSAK